MEHRPQSIRRHQSFPKFKEAYDEVVKEYNSSLDLIMVNVGSPTDEEYSMALGHKVTLVEDKTIRALDLAKTLPIAERGTIPTAGAIAVAIELGKQAWTALNEVLLEREHKKRTQEEDRLRKSLADQRMRPFDALLLDTHSN